MPNAIPDINEYRGYHIYFWSDEQKPLEPVHIHFSKGRPTKNATKYWLNSDGTIEQEHNHSQIPSADLKKLERLILQYHQDIIRKWEDYFKVPATFHDSHEEPDDFDCK